MVDKEVAILAVSYETLSLWFWRVVMKIGSELNICKTWGIFFGVFIGPLGIMFNFFTDINLLPT